MFTGIIHELGEVISAIEDPGKKRLAIKVSADICEKAELGQSVAVDGVCLSVTKVHKCALEFDAIEETCSLTTIGRLQEGNQVHIETSLRFGDQIGGHIISGHVHGTADVISFDENPDFAVLTLKTPADWIKYIMPKGFISLSGASLTVVNVEEHSSLFTVHLIPDTLHRTHFPNALEHGTLNFEVEQNTLTMVNVLERTLKKFLKK